MYANFDVMKMILNMVIVDIIIPIWYVYSPDACTLIICIIICIAMLQIYIYCMCMIIRDMLLRAFNLGCFKKPMEYLISINCCVWFENN